MAENPLRKSDRISQNKFETGDIRQSITLFDVDYAIMTYLQDVVLPPIDDNGQSIKVPVIYGNSERWNGARREGIYRDNKGRIQLPLVMLRRTTVAKNDAMPMLNRHVSYQSITKWSKDNRYNRFNILTGNQPKYSIHNITMPDYVEINYECMGWTSYTEQLNTIIESLNWASDEYWGDKKKFKFNTTITDYNVVNEVGEGTERINRVEFTLNVKAYLLPEKFDGEPTTRKGFNLKKVVVTAETDLTANGRIGDLLSTPTKYNDNKDLLEFLALNESISQIPTINDTITFSNIKLIKAPGTLINVVSGNLTIDGIDYDVKVYKNGVKLNQTANFNVVYNTNNYTLLVNFTSGLVGTTDEISIVGKFITL